MKWITTTDYLIVGAGSAGCVLANRLSESGKNKITVLEAGPMDRFLMIHVPAGVAQAYRNPKINWNYTTENEPFLYGRNVGTPRGKVIGGSSSINSMVYMRGHPKDYDKWHSEFGLNYWSFDQCLPYFRKCESSERGESQWHGANGPLSVSKAKLQNPLFDVFLEAGELAGQGLTEDPNGYNPEGVSRLDSTKRNGRRCSAAVAHLSPAMRRKNVELVTNANVQRILFEKNRAVGVEYISHGEVSRIEAQKEVILCGGAINSPHLLMLSGIGPAEQLKEHSLDVLVNLPGVGKNLQDHATVIMSYVCKKPVTIHNYSNCFVMSEFLNSPLSHKVNSSLAGLQWLFTRTGIGATNGWEAGGCIRGNDGVDYANLQYHFGPFGMEFIGEKLKLDQAFCIHIDQLRPKSRGEVRLRSGSPNEKPTILFNYMEKSYDLDEMLEGVKKARELVSQRVFDEFRGIETKPGGHINTDKDLKYWIRSAVETDYHPCSTCKMGNDAMAVVDQEMRVYGTESLRVVDASVIPKIVSGNLNAPTQMIGERAADFIQSNAQLKSEFAEFSFID